MHLFGVHACVHGCVYVFVCVCVCVCVYMCVCVCVCVRARVYKRERKSLYSVFMFVSVYVSRCVRFRISFSGWASLSVGVHL